MTSDDLVTEQPAAGAGSLISTGVPPNITCAKVSAARGSSLTTRRDAV